MFIVILMFKISRKIKKTDVDVSSLCGEKITNIINKCHRTFQIYQLIFIDESVDKFRIEISRFFTEILRDTKDMLKNFPQT